MDKDIKVSFLVIFLIVILLSIFSTFLSYHDSPEYITIAKYFAGIDNVSLFSAHSIIYPLITSFFLKISLSDIMLRFSNLFWILLISIFFYFLTKNKKAFYLLIFSPILWIVGIQTTPVLPASFFFMLSYLIFIKEKFKFRFILSGIFGGISIMFYDPMLIVISIFGLVFFWKEKFKEFFVYGIGIGIGLLPRLIIDYKIFGNPIYTFIRYFGANVLISLGVRESTNFGIFKEFYLLLPLIFIISPLLFYIYKLNFNKYKKELIFITIVTLFFLIRIFHYKYFLIFTPIIVIMLSEILDKRKIKLNSILSVFIIIIFLWSSFGFHDDEKIRKDIESITNDFETDQFLTYSFQANNLAIHSWNDEPKFIWQSDYDSYLKNKTIMKQYVIDSPSKISLREKLIIRFDFERPSDKDYSNLAYMVARKRHSEGIKNTPSLQDFILIKCYEELCVYGKQISSKNIVVSDTGS